MIIIKGNVNYVIENYVIDTKKVKNVSFYGNNFLFGILNQCPGDIS